jgi:CelD/BcsL family acetyltransferase involved in cellulose biosynthesis
VDLPRVPADSPTLDALRRASAGKARVVIRPAAGTPTIALAPAWSDPMRRVGARRRSDLRRAQRHAEDRGEVTCEVLAPSWGPGQAGASLEALLDEAFAIEARSWKGRAGTALALDPLRGPFFRDVARAAAAAGRLRLAVLRIGGQGAAMQIAEVSHGRLWLLKIGYDPAFAGASPGQLLMLHMLGWAARNGLHSVEFLGEPSLWTAAWTRTLRPCARVRLYPATPPGALAWLQDLPLHRLWRPGSWPRLWR